MRSTAFFAVAVWATIRLWNELGGTEDRDLALLMFVLILAAIGGGVGALFGKAPLGVFSAIAFIYALIVLAIITAFAIVFFSWLGRLL